MHSAALSIDWIKFNGDIYSKDEIATKLLNHQNILAYGHYGATMFWTVKTLKHIYNKGWNQWIHKYIYD